MMESGQPARYVARTGNNHSLLQVTESHFKSHGCLLLQQNQLCPEDIDIVKGNIPLYKITSPSMSLFWGPNPHQGGICTV